MSVERKRDVWIDNIKVVACLLVVLGHFYQSMVKSDLMVDTFFYTWFENTIYYFHVPLFFICSGFLYQKYSKVRSFSSWKYNVLKKLMALGIPYFVFSFATWILKKVFSGSVNSELGGIVETLFLHPAAPYWYLYTLFIIFFFSLTTDNKKNQVYMLVVAFILKILSVLGVHSGLYFIDMTMRQWIWFVLGMMLTYEMRMLLNCVLGMILFGVFLMGSYITELYDLNSRVIGFVLAFLACYSITSVIYRLYMNGEQNIFMAFLSKYTMPIFLMHTLFAAPFRSVLLKIGINNVYLHWIMGLSISIFGPILAMIIMEKLKPLDIMVYPGRYITFRRKMGSSEH